MILRRNISSAHRSPGASYRVRYDSEQRLTGTTVLAGTANAQTSTTAYNAKHDPISSTDPEGRVTTFVWDNRRLLHCAVAFDMTEPRRMWHTRIAGDPRSERALNHPVSQRPLETTPTPTQREDSP